MDKTEPQMMQVPEGMKRTIKASVFSDLFSQKKYLLQLYQTLHPEDTTTTEDDLKDITIENILVDDLYNDLGFMVSDQLMILLEAQSTWTENILVRAMLYMSQTWRRYFIDSMKNLYANSRVNLPKPEIYVIYTGDRKDCPSELSLSKVFFGGKECAVEVRAKIIYGEGEGNIITQYVTFCKVLKEQVKLRGKTRKALSETIRICKERDVLREYLEEREVEVMDIMTMLFDQETVTNTYINDVLRQGRAEGEAKGLAKGRAEGEARGNIQGAVGMCRDFGASRDETVARVARMFNLSEADAQIEVDRYWPV
ncbi:MAG: hypothetical protein GX256_08880 [Fretibacterium sp.]|nr:hypothetical protein [Fretibacterium sp.]